MKNTVRSLGKVVISSETGLAQINADIQIIFNFHPDQFLPILWPACFARKVFPHF